MANILHVANGRRLATRRIVMKTTSTLKAQVWRKQIIYNETTPNQPIDPLSFESLQLSQQDEPTYRYDYLMQACVLLDKYQGGYLHDNDSMNNHIDIAINAQIELFDDELDEQQQIMQIPQEQLKTGDILAISLPTTLEQDPILLWFEVVGINGQSALSDFAKKYSLNRRDDLMQQLFE